MLRFLSPSPQLSHPGPLKFILYNADWITIQKHKCDLLSSLSEALR